MGLEPHCVYQNLERQVWNYYLIWTKRVKTDSFIEEAHMTDTASRL